MADPVAVPARETIQSHSTPPAPGSTLYFHRSERTLTTGVKESVIAGVTVVFEAGHANGLYEAFNTARSEKLNPSTLPAKRALLVACDTLEISGTLSLPEWDVKIFARKLVFRNQGNISTMPLDWTTARAQDGNPQTRAAGGDGAEGRAAGALAVFVSEVEEPAHESMARFIARGGRGQDAGNGCDGADGSHMTGVDDVFKHHDTGPENVYTAPFANPCVYVTYKWWWVVPINTGERGANRWPTSGQDAVKPGIARKGGDGGAWTSNQAALAARADNAGSAAGAVAPSVKGGGYGAPKKSTHYKLTLRYNLFGSTPGADLDLLETHDTNDGAGYQEQDPKPENGKTPDKKTIAAENAWVHPLQLECVLRFARDAFLAESRDQVTALLTPYERALSLPPPAAAGVELPWSSGESARWTSAQADVAGMLYRLRNRLDYFGNPAGYMPLLSLQASMRLYDLETASALKTLMLAFWVQRKADAEQSAANAFGYAIEQTNAENARVADQLVAAEEKSVTLQAELTTLATRLTGLAKKIDTLRAELMTEAANDLNKQHLIKFGVKMAGAICQVIPIGQPVLGTIGKIADIAADIKEDGVADTASKIGDTIKKAKEAGDKAKKSKDEAKKKEAAADAPEAKKKASAWADAGKGLGPALSMAGKAIAALEVSEEEVEEELAKLIAASPKWKELTERIRELNKDKARLFADLSAVLQAIGDGYARLASNAESLVTLHEERSEKLGRLSPEANLAVARMGQTARLSLQRTLYLLVKAYETTVLKPIEMDWSFDLVLDKIATLMEPRKGFDVAALDSLVKDLTPIADANAGKVKERLLSEYKFGDNPNSISLEFGYTATQTPRQLEALRDGNAIVLDPVAAGLILPTHERAKAAAFTCKTLVFDPAGPMPASGNAVVSLRTSGDGTVRSAEHLYAVRSDAPRVWTWTYHFSDRQLQPVVPSLSALDLLNFLLKTSDDATKQKLASPPVWSDLTVKLEFTPPLAPAQRPKLQSLIFVCAVDPLSAPATQCVLDVRAGSEAAEVAIAPGDLMGRTGGAGSVYRIFGKGVPVKVTAPEQLAGRPFEQWDVVDSRTSTTVKKRGLDLTLDSNTVAYCRYAGGVTTSHAVRAEFAKLSPAQVDEMFGPQAEAVRAMLAREDTPAVKSELAVGARVIRSAPDPAAPVIAIAGAGDEMSPLEPAAGGWTKVACGTRIGYAALPHQGP